jgi:hypothetical protein
LASRHADTLLGLDAESRGSIANAADVADDALVEGTCAIESLA